MCSLFDYTAERDDELSFHCGEQLKILKRGDASERDWWWAENRKKGAGYVPYNLLGVSHLIFLHYVEIIGPVEDLCKGTGGYKHYIKTMRLHVAQCLI